MVFTGLPQTALLGLGGIFQLVISIARVVLAINPRAALFDHLGVDVSTINKYGANMPLVSVRRRAICGNDFAFYQRRKHIRRFATKRLFLFWGVYAVETYPLLSIIAIQYGDCVTI